MGSCVFSDIVQFCNIPTRVSSIQKYAVKVKMALKATPRSRCWCVVHKRNCEVRPTDIAAGGSPCVDHSLIGKRAGTAGNTFICFLSWARWISGMDIGLAVHENVPQFPRQVVHDLLSSTHHIVELQLDHLQSSEGIIRALEPPRSGKVLQRKRG